VTITTPVIGQGLTWNGTNWVNATASGGGDLLALNNLDDVINTQTALNNLIDGDNNIHTTGTIRWSTNIANIGGLPPANTYRGMFAAVNGAGGAYYSNGTEWLRLDTALLNDLNDVNTADVTNGQVLAYQSGNWIPTTMAAGPTTTTNLPEGANLYHTDARVDARIELAELSDLLNVSNTAATNGQYLAWDSVTSNWVPTTPTSTFTSPLTTKGDLHTYSTTDARLGVGANNSFLVADSSTATGLRWQAALSLNNITDVNAPDPNDNDVLTWTGTEWEAVTPAPSLPLPTVVKGDLAVQSATTLVRLPVGSDGQALLADSTTTTGLRWGAAGSGSGGTLAGLSDVAVTSPTQGQVLTWNASTSRWNAANPSNQVSLNRQLLTGVLILTLSSAGTQHLDPNGMNRDVFLPPNPTTGTRFRILNLAPAFNILVKDPNTNTTVLTLGNSSTSIQAEFTWDGVGWYFWEAA
jgi:hypothetical protein